MPRRRFQIAIVLVTAILTIAGYCSVTFPKKQGVVSDYAGKLTKAQIRELSDRISQYEQKTSIEIAVVVVDDLQGLTAQQYAISVGDSWGVGKAGLNNGVILLWAPNERKYSLRFGPGLTPDMSDGEATTITQQYLLPNFKQREYYAGLKQTLQAVMRHLGDATWDQRMQSRAQLAEEQRRREAARQEAERKEKEQFVQIMIAFFAVLGLVIGAGIAIYKWAHHREERTELARAAGEISENLAQAEANLPHIGEILDSFSKEAPEQDLTALRADVEGQSDRIVKLRLDATLLDYTRLQSYDEMVRIRTAAQDEAGFRDKTQQQLDSILEAKRSSQAMMERLSHENFEISDVRDGSRRGDIDGMLAQSRLNYEQARQNSSLSLVDWLIINDMLNRSNTGFRQAVEYSQEEPEETSSSTSSSSSSSDSSSSIFGNSSSESSFGSSSSDSGSFGGGGGFSSGSGSDGSY
jgi:uncharacterized protein